MLENASNDVVFALRMMKHRPAFTAIVVMTLAIGIGATTAMFGTINTALLSSLPFEEPDRLVMGRATFSGRVNPWVSGYDYYDYREQSESFTHLAAFMFGGRVTVLGGDEPQLVDSAFGTWDLFHALGVRPIAGRLFVADEGVEDGPAVVMVSYSYWQQHMGGGAEAVGSSINMNGNPHTVVGVLPPGFYFMADADIWRLTYRNGPGAEARRWHNLLLVGRLEDGVSIGQARAEVDAISTRLQELYPETNENKALAVTDLHEALVENVRPSLLMLMGAVSLVLMLGCSNVAGLLLARGQGRMSEIAMRSALGASRPRLMRQLFTESMVLALVSGLIGVGLAYAFQRMLLQLLPMGRLGVTQPTVDMTVLLFALVLSIATGILFGIAPAVQGTLVNLALQLRSGARATWARGSSRLRNALVVFQVAVSVMLLIGAGLLIRSLARQLRVDLGYDPENVLTAAIALPSSYETTDERIAFFDTLIERVEALPGVTSTGLVNRLPIVHGGGNIYIYPVDQPLEGAQASMRRSADFRYMTPGYLETMGIPILTGRDVARTDAEDSPRVMLVSESVAEMFFEGENPLGKRLIVDMGEPVEHEIIGIVPNTRLRRVTSEPFHAMYMSYYQIGQTWMCIAARTQGNPEQLIEPMREILKELDHNIPLAQATSMEAIVSNSMSDFRVITSSLGLLSSIALLLALVGLYGVLAFYVSQRTHEIGVRMVLGANTFKVANLVLSRGMAMVAVGLVIGLVASYWATDLVQRLLFEVGATDPITFIGATMGFGVVAFVACLVPAWRATRADPAQTLQAE
jgi:putative ABC transport system permease protein